jgi:hypothetical protein
MPDLLVRMVHIGSVYTVNLSHIDTVFIYVPGFVMVLLESLEMCCYNNSLPHHFSPLVKLVKSTVVITVCSYTSVKHCAGE